ncbi:hypothetical protein [Embleya sp. NBC_00896]|uniref:hypothetical protein n=1 Tax=Embleya sp. NBC_00896 TaxID=2975961 RepID=UPI003862E6AA|nr:hypothetical protein OG928_32160 [Embleya sp. NBC_00896]
MAWAHGVGAGRLGGRPGLVEHGQRLVVSGGGEQGLPEVVALDQDPVGASGVGVPSAGERRHRVFGPVAGELQQALGFPHDPAQACVAHHTQEVFGAAQFHLGSVVVPQLVERAGELVAHANLGVGSAPGR